MGTQSSKGSSNNYIFKKTTKKDALQKLQKIKNQFDQDAFQQFLTTYYMNNHNNKIIPEHLYHLFLKQVDEWRLTKYCTRFPNDSRSGLLFRISHINFSRLKELKLPSNNIRNIQPLTWLNAPCLIELELHRNKIGSLKPLAKLNLKKLRDISLKQNTFSNLEIHHLSKIKGSIRIILISSIDKYVPIDIPHPLIKLESSQIVSQMMNSCLINQKIIDTFSKRFKDNEVLNDY